MVANALAIALRELTEGKGAELAVLRALKSALGENAANSTIEYNAPETVIAVLERQLAVEIRRGAFDRPGSARETVRKGLAEITAERIRLSNPKALSSINGDVNKKAGSDALSKPAKAGS
jgi:hypothetical protein